MVTHAGTRYVLISLEDGAGPWLGLRAWRADVVVVVVGSLAWRAESTTIGHAPTELKQKKVSHRHDTRVELKKPQLRLEMLLLCSIP